MIDVPDFMKGAADVVGDAARNLQRFGEVLRDAGLGPTPPPERPPFIEGAFENMPAEDYFRVEALSQSAVDAMLHSPSHFRFQRDTPSKPTERMIFGTAVHAGVLEPDSFAARVCFSPAVDKRTKFGKAEWAAFEAANPGRLVLSSEDYDRARRCVDAVLASKPAAYLLEGAIRETSIFWTDARYKVPCKARLDLRARDGIVDLKTTKDASREDFAKSIANFGYDTQAAFYFSGCEHVFDATPKFFAIIAVESEPPYGVACYVLGSATILAGAHKVDRALAGYADALASGGWPGYPEEITTIDSPAWARRFNL